MGTDIALVLSKLPTASLPPRVAALAMSLGTVQHPGQPLRYDLPANYSLTDAERTEVEALRSTLAQFLDKDIPFDGVEPGDAKLMILTTMLMGYAVGTVSADGNSMSYDKPTYTGNDAKFDLYDMAIDDVPAWAVAAALRLWTRRECPAHIEKNPLFKYAPSPATLRGLALYEIEPYRRSVQRLTNLLSAVSTKRAMDPTPLPRENSISIVPAMKRM